MGRPTVAQRRRLLAMKANQVAALARYGGAPRLSEHSTALEVATWLQWWDPNGSHHPDLARRDGFRPYTIAVAWGVLAEAVDGSW